MNLLLIGTFICVHIYVSVLCVHLYVHMLACSHVNIYMCVFVCMGECADVCICAYPYLSVLSYNVVTISVQIIM